MARTKFKRQESWRYKRLKEAWRRPRGGTNRIRLEQSGWPRKPDIGLATNHRTKGMHPSGLEERLIRQARDLEGLDSKVHIVRLSHRLGEKKRLTIIDRARQMGLFIANPGTSETQTRRITGGEEEQQTETKETRITKAPGDEEKEEEEGIEAEAETTASKREKQADEPELLEADTETETRREEMLEEEEE